MALAATPASALSISAHCWCNLGPASKPYKSFGEIAKYSTSIGHGKACANSCASAAAGWMATNRNAVCKAANQGTVTAYSWVGAGAKTAAWSFECTPTCPAANSGQLRFDDSGSPGAPLLTVNNNSYSNTLVTNIPDPSGCYSTFSVAIPLGVRIPAHTFTAQLFRNNTLVQTLTGKSPILALDGLVATATFTQQPNAGSNVQSARWTINWLYMGSPNPKGSFAFTFAP